ncbi:MAG: 2-hydroxychromene-2-carboxylate isomerase [Alphaproteobacteria bacterium]
MTREIEFFFDVGSPTSYLAYTQLPKLGRETKNRIVFRPMLLGAVFQATGNASPMMVPAKARYMLDDMVRAAQKFGVPFVMNKHFPINTLHLMRGALAAGEDGWLMQYCNVVFSGMWVQNLNMGDPEVVARALTDAGLDAATIAAKAGQTWIKEKLKANTDEAIERGVFGAPTFFVRGQMFFGQDRIDDVAAAARA